MMRSRWGRGKRGTIEVGVEVALTAAFSDILFATKIWDNVLHLSYHQLHSLPGIKIRDHQQRVICASEILGQEVRSES